MVKLCQSKSFIMYCYFTVHMYLTGIVFRALYADDTSSEIQKQIIEVMNKWYRNQSSGNVNSSRLISKYDKPPG